MDRYRFVRIERGIIPIPDNEMAILSKPMELTLSALQESGNMGLERITPDIITEDLTASTDIRTDRWELALAATDAIEKNAILARTQAIVKAEEGQIPMKDAVTEQ